MWWFSAWEIEGEGRRGPTFIPQVEGGPSLLLGRSEWVVATTRRRDTRAGSVTVEGEELTN
jgi:hypothetical protein